MKDRKIEGTIVSERCSRRSRRFLILLVACVTMATTGPLTSTAGAASLTLADKGASEYQIVLSTNAIPSERYAAEELQRYLQKITNAKFPIVTDAERLQGREILLGDNAHLR